MTISRFFENATWARLHEESGEHTRIFSLRNTHRALDRCCVDPAMLSADPSDFTIKLIYPACICSLLQATSELKEIARTSDLRSPLYTNFGRAADGPRAVAMQNSVFSHSASLGQSVPPERTFAITRSHQHLPPRRHHLFVTVVTGLLVQVPFSFPQLPLLLHASQLPPLRLIARPLQTRLQTMLALLQQPPDPRASD